MSTSTPPPPPPSTTMYDQLPEEGKKYVPLAITGLVLSLLFSILFAIGAATLSYRRYGSVFWAIIAFFFAPVYYTFYALYLDRPQPSSPNGMQAIMGGVRKIMKKA